MAMTGTSYSATTGNTRSSRSSSPVTLLTMGRPLAALMPAMSAGTTELSMQSGTSVRCLHQFDDLDHQVRLGPLGLDAGDADIDVQNVGARRDLRQGITLDAAEVAGQHLGLQLLAPGGVDALADDDKRFIRSDDDGLGW